MKSFLFLLSALGPAAITNAQPLSIADIPLTWKDFTVKKDFAHHPFSAKIYTRLPYKYEIKEKGTDKRLIITMEVVISAQSWVKKEFMDKSSKEQKQELLDHEKGHLILTLIQFRQLQQLLSTHSFSKRIKPEIDSIYKTADLTLDSLNVLYDTTTNHMRAAAKQQKWIERLMKQLNDAYLNGNKLVFKKEIEIMLQ